MLSPSIAIRGAGAAGLSLAHALVHCLPGAAVTMFDQRPRLPHPQRTFCFFGDAEAIYPVPPSFRWNRVGFAGQGFARSIDCRHAPYSLTRGDDFFAAMLDELESRGTRFHWDCGELEISAHAVRTPTAAWNFDYVVDAAFRPQDRQAVLWQSFAGIWVRSSEPIFDPAEALLMELQESADESPVRFAYLLPTSPYTALVEHTAFSKHALPREWHLAECRRWLAARGVHRFAEEETEYGAIPLGLKSIPVNTGPLRIGSNAGVIRASTGYAFQSIQRQAVDLAQRIAEAAQAGTETVAEREPPFPAWLRLSDTLFLQALARAPLRGASLMQGLLSASPEKELVRFLSGTVSLWEALRVMVNVPKLAMIRALVLGGR